MGKSGSGNDWMLFNKSTFPSLISLRINSPNSVFCRVDLVQVKLFELFLFFSLEHQFYFYREMVRGRAGLISFDVDFFRTVRCVLLASVSSDTAIRVCQHTISFYFENRRDEYMVDAAFRETVRIEIIEFRLMNPFPIGYPSKSFTMTISPSSKLPIILAISLSYTQAPPAFNVRPSPFFKLTIAIAIHPPYLYSAYQSSTE